MTSKIQYWWDFVDDVVVVQSVKQPFITAFNCIESAEDFIKKLEQGNVALNSDGTLKK